MLPSGHRLRRSADFTAVVRGGRRAGRRHLVVHLLPAPVGPPPGADAVPGPALVGFVVSKAVGGSVVRNRVERRLRHLAKDHLHRFPEGSRAVVRANPAAAGATHEQLARDLIGALAKLDAGRPAPGTGAPQRGAR